MRNSVTLAIREHHPAYFALVMSTGIVSIAAFLLGMKHFAFLLFWTNVVAYIVLRR